ncbi:hypothetical protein AMECASPLE_026435 [Ameca splendens]|uniref:Uncharacterized protein n=1 Tax=Ameca splendens TaxID=208324 RepID=A0ABV0Z2U0_9TELE
MKTCTHKCVPLSESAPSYIYLQPLLKRPWLQLGHFGQGQYYFGGVDRSTVSTYLWGLQGYQAVKRGVGTFLFLKRLECEGFAQERQEETLG